MTEQRISEGQFRRFLKSAERVKVAISLADYCRDRGVALKPVGRSLAGLCPIHSEKSASFNVYPDQRFKCYGCQATGDVLELHQRLEGLPSVWDSLVSLAEEYGVELPRCSDRWHEQQNQKGKIRDAAKKRLARSYQRKLVRLYAPLVLVGGMDPREELEELEGLSSDLWPIALDWAERRVNGE